MAPLHLPPDIRQPPSTRHVPPVLLVDSHLHRLLRRLNHSATDRADLPLWAAQTLEGLGLIDADRLPTPQADALVHAFYLHDQRFERDDS